MCSGCSKLAFVYTKKTCHRCQGAVVVNIAVICELCSAKDHICTVCLKRIQNSPPRTKGCGCGKK
jgi:hypothetical protein